MSQTNQKVNKPKDSKFRSQMLFNLVSHIVTDVNWHNTRYDPKHPITVEEVQAEVARQMNHETEQNKDTQ